MMNRIIRIVLPIVFVIAGCFLIFLGITNIRNRKIFDETTAVITHIEETYVGDEDNEYEYDVTIKYDVAGHTYETSLGEYNSKMKEGQEIGIYYNPKNPEDVMSNSKATPIIMFVMGIIGIIAGVSGFIRGLR